MGKTSFCPVRIGPGPGKSYKHFRDSHSPESCPENIRDFIGPFSEIETSKSRQLVSLAAEHAAEAARLNSYDPEVPTVQAVVSAKENANAPTIRSFLARAVQLAPADGNVRVNLAVFDGATGNFEELLRQLENASFIQKAQDKEQIPAIPEIRRQLEKYRIKR